MPWIGTAHKDRHDPPPMPPPLSLEWPTTIAARGTRPTAATIEALSPAQCRLRSVAFLDQGAGVGFDLGAADRQKIFVRGHITTRTANGPRFIYEIALARMTSMETDGLI